MRLSLATKVFVGFIVILGTSALLAVLSVREIRSVARDLRAIKEGHLALARIAAQLETHQQNRFRDLRRALEEPERRNQEVILRIAVAYFPEVVQASLRQLRQVASKQMARSQQSGADREAAGTGDFYHSVLRRIDVMASHHDRIDDLARVTLRRVQTRRTLAGLVDQLDRLERILRTEAKTLNQRINAETDRAVRRAEQNERHGVWRIIGMTTLAVMIGLLLTILSARALAPIGRLVEFARAISRGDYHKTITLRSNNELSSLADELKLMAEARRNREEELDRQAHALEQAYRRVQDLKRYHEIVIHSLKTAVVVTDRALKITSSNRAAQSSWQLDSQAIQGATLESLPLGQSLTNEVGPLDSLVSHQETIHANAVPLGDRLADATIAPLENEKGDVLGLVVALEDVTEAVRTKEALIRSERLAAIGRMSAHVTHEIRNPLSSIGLNAELLETLMAEFPNADHDVDEGKNLCRAIIREVDRLTGITEEYLKFARLPRPELHDENVEKLLQAIAQFVARDCEAANVSMEVHVQDELPPAHIDVDQIRQALLNLVRNAKESMPEGGRLVLGAKGDGEEIILFVRDTGGGIPQERLDRIFDPFYSTKLTGTGLGLALSQQIVVEHGGRLEVSSNEGQGSEFRISLTPPSTR